MRLLLSLSSIGGLLRAVAIPHFRRHRLRTSSTVFGIALGVAVFVAVLAVNRSILGSVASTIEDIAGSADLQVTSGASGFDEGLLAEVRRTPGVEQAALVLEQMAIIRDQSAAGERLLVLGVDLLNAEDGTFRSYGSAELQAIERDPLAFLNSPYHLVLGRAVADRFGYELHDRILLQTPSGIRPFEIWGFIEGKNVGAAFGGSMAVMDYGAMQIAFDRGHNVDRIDVAVTSGSDVDSVAHALESAVGSAFSIERPTRRTERVGKMLDTLQTGLTVASLVSLLVGMFLIHNTMWIGVVQRRREIGILRAVGAKRRQVLLLFTAEGALLGALGSLLGVLLGILLARVLLHQVSQTVNAVIVPIAATELEVEPALLAGAWGLGLLVATLAAVLPARDAARASPLEALARETAPRAVAAVRKLTWADVLSVLLFLSSALLLELPPVRGLPLGSAAACATLICSFVLLAPRFVQVVYTCARLALRLGGGIAATIGSENLRRNLGRSSATAAAVMVGVAMTTSFAAFVGSFVSSTVDWVDQMLPADLWITSGSRMSGGAASVPIGNELMAALSRLPEVESVERARITDMGYQGFPIKLVATDLQTMGRRSRWQMLEGTQEECVSRMQRGAVAVSENFSRRFDVHRGNRIALGAKNGTRWFDVAGVIVDYTSDVGVVVLDYATYSASWGDDRVETYKLYLHDGANREATRRTILQQFGDRYNLFVLTNREFRDEIVNTLRSAFTVMRGLEVAAIVISLLGIVNSLLANVLDRVREIAVLRAVGMLERQVRVMIVTEGFLIGVVGALGGVLLGFVLGRVILGYINVIQTGWYLPYRPAWSSVLETVSLVVGVSALSGWYPAKQAMALGINDALKYE